MHTKEVEIELRKLNADILSLVSAFEEKTDMHLDYLSTEDAQRADGKKIVIAIRTKAVIQ